MRVHHVGIASDVFFFCSVISYEWGSPNWVGALSPDDTAQAEIAKAYSQFGGGWATSDPYSYGAYVIL